MGKEKEKDEEKKELDVLEPEAAPSSGEEEHRTADGKRKKEKNQYTAADFKFAQPLLKRHLMTIAVRSSKRFAKYHPLIEFKRDNPKKEERAKIWAAGLEMSIVLLDKVMKY